MTFWRAICYCHSRLADRELLFINLDETSVGHTMTPPIGCVAKPRTAGGKQPHAQVLKQHVRGAWTYLCQRDLQLQAHPREVASFFHWHPGETHEEALARPARFATNSFACFAAKVRLDLCCQQCPNSQRDRRSAEKFSVKTRRCILLDCAPAHLPRQVMAMARKCKLQLIYIPAQTTDYLQPLDLQGFSPFKQYLKRKHQELRSYSEHGLVPPLAWLWQCMQAPHEFWAARQWQKSFDAVGCNGPGQVHKALQHLMGAGVPWPGPDRPTPQQMQCVWPARRQMAHAYKVLFL